MANKPLYLSQSAIMALRRVISYNMPARPFQDCGELKSIYEILCRMTDDDKPQTWDLFENEFPPDIKL